MNYFTLIEDIKRTSLQFAEEFYEGDVYEFLNSGNHKYPSIILTTQNVSTTDNINSISGTLFCVDRLTDDSSNRLEIQSNAFNKLQRIFEALEENTINLQSNTYTPFAEKFADLCGGMFVEFSLKYIGESLCDDLEIKEIELTQNGIYDVIGYDRAIVNVRPVVNLEDITITYNGEYTCGEGFDGFGKVNVDLRGKVKVNSFKVTNDCINEEGRWEGDELIDTSNCTSLANVFNGNTAIKSINVSNWNTSNVTTFGALFYGCRNLSEIKGIENFNVSKMTNCDGVFRLTAITSLDLNKWDVSQCTTLAQLFREIPNLTNLYIDQWNTSKVTNFSNCFLSLPKLKTIDITNWDFSNATNVAQIFHTSGIANIIGGRTIEDVLENNISVLNGLKVGFGMNTGYMDRASLRAIINGLADLSDTTTQTLTLGAKLRAKLTEEDIAIATAKNWTIA